MSSDQMVTLNGRVIRGYNINYFYWDRYWVCLGQDHSLGHQHEPREESAEFGDTVSDVESVHCWGAQLYQQWQLV